MDSAFALKRFLPFALIALVAVLTVGAGTLLFRKMQARAAQAVAAAAAEAAAAEPADGGKPGARPPHIRGDARAKVTVEEFADLQCPPCSMLGVVLHKLEREYQGRVRFIFRHYPLQNHQNARPAALAAEAAGSQGKFWEMHDLLYKNQVGWSKVPDIRPILTGYAGTLGLDLTKFAADFDKPEHAARIAADQERAASLGVRQTPTVFVDGKLVPVSALSEKGIRELIERALAGGAAP